LPLLPALRKKSSDAGSSAASRRTSRPSRTHCTTRSSCAPDQYVPAGDRGARAQVGHTGWLDSRWRKVEAAMRYATGAARMAPMLLEPHRAPLPATSDFQVFRLIENGDPRRICFEAPGGTSLRKRNRLDAPAQRVQLFVHPLELRVRLTIRRVNELVQHLCRPPRERASEDVDLPTTQL
jgi:hypothetical protein